MLALMWFLVSKRGFSHLYSVALPSGWSTWYLCLIRFVLIVGPPTVGSQHQERVGSSKNKLRA